MFLLGELASKFIAYWLILDCCWCACSFLHRKFEVYSYSVKSADSLAGLCRTDEINKCISGNNIYIALSKVILPFRVKSKNSLLTPKTEDRTVYAIRNVSVEYQSAIFTLRIKLHSQRSCFACRAGNRILRDCLLK